MLAALRENYSLTRRSREHEEMVSVGIKGLMK